MSEEKSNVTSDSQGNNDTSTTPQKTQEIWGKREGRKYFRFTAEMKDIEGSPVHPYLYKFKEQKKIGGKEVIVLQLNGQEEERKFYKEELYKHFPGKKQHAIYCTEEEAEFVKNFLKDILRDEKCLKIFRKNNISEIQEAITSLL